MRNVVWAQQKGPQRWVVAIKPPLSPEEFKELVNTFAIVRVEKLPSGNVALYLWATPKNVAKLMVLPPPKWGGSRHECNRVRW